MTKSNKKSLFVFVVGLMSYFKFRLLGTFYGNEILAFLSYLFIDWHQFKNNKYVITLIKFAFIWLIGVLLSDYLNDTEKYDFYKGTFNVIFLILLIPFVYWMMYDKPARWLYYAAGSAIALAVSFYTGRGMEIALGSEENLDIWETYFFFPFAVFIAGYSYFKNRHLFSYIVIISYGLWALFSNSRNIFLTSVLSVFVLCFIDVISKSDVSYNIKVFRRKIIAGIVVVLLSLLCADIIYEEMASNGTLGEKALAKYEMQKNDKHGLASARIDFFQSLDFIVQRPIVGYGSYATFRKPHVYQASKEVGYPVYDRNKMVPGHFHILGAWVYSGILGLIYWVFILYYLFKVLRSGKLLYEPKLLGFRIYVFFSCFWNILFSPFQNRIDVLLLIVSFMIVDRTYFIEKT